MYLDKILPKYSKRRKFMRKIYYKFLSKYSEDEKIYNKWILNNEPNKRELEKQRSKKFNLEPKISVVVPVYKTPKRFMKELIESLQKQTYSNWELCLADGGEEPISYIKDYIKGDKRIKYKEIGENKGISGNTNEAIIMATGEYIALLDHDDLLPPFALYEIVKTINENPKTMLIYSDEDKLEKKSGPRYGVFFKPDFSPYTLNSANYICHFTILKRELMNQLEGFRSKYDGSQDFDIVARASELTKEIIHIPKVLYHWRAHRNSTAGNSESKPYAFEVGKMVIKDHIKRSLDTDVEVLDSLTLGSYEVHYKVKGNPKVSIILDGINIGLNEIERVLNEVKKSTYSNYEILLIISNKDTVKQENITVDKFIIASEDKVETYNSAIERCEGEYFIIFDKNLRRIDKNEYIEDLLGICQDNSVGIVGTKLYNERSLIEHSGIILGMNGIGDYIYKGVHKDSGTYMQRLAIIHNVTAVYIKYSMIKKSTFLEIDKFPKYNNNIMLSVDACLKILKLNKQVVLNPIISFEVNEIIDEYIPETEKNNFIIKWQEFYNNGDIYFSPNLSKNNTNLEIEIKKI